ncbi:MAG: PepSY-like domain-containing protein [Bacteroidaceae bacterium]|nr:PepSY-like domain-containing protein [Bacteroidaceae bacterium]
MKKIFSLMAFCLCLSTFSFYSCNDDNDDMVGPEVDAAVATFQAKYPTCKVAKWEWESGYLKAEFIKDSREAEAYFNTDGTWVKTVTELLPIDLPQAAIDYINTNYPDRRTRDVDLVETPGNSMYLVELEKSKTADIYLRFATDGTLL